MNEVSIRRTQARDLGSVVRFSFLKTALIPILTVQLVLLCLYFFSAGYITEKNMSLLHDNALQTVSEITKTEAQIFDDQLREISRNNLSLQAEHEAMFRRPAPDYSYDEKLFMEKVGYDLNQNLNPAGFSSLYLSSKTKMNPRMRRKITKTTEMDNRFRTLVDNNPNIVTAYFNSWDNMARIYPAMDNFYDQFPYDFDLTRFNFYYLADQINNPKRSSIWTRVYLDPAGKGWMLSNLVPIYQNNFLEGVTGLDVTLGTFSKHILSSNLQWNSGAMVMDGQGNILTMSRAAENYLGLTDVSDYNYKDNPVDRTLTKPTRFNLLKQNTLTGMYFSEFFNGNEKSLEFTLNGEEFLVTKQEISETGWQLFILAPLKNVYGPILLEKEKLTQLGLIFLALAALFYLAYFVYLSRASKMLAKRITKPISQVTKMIMARNADDKTFGAHDPVNITELDNLLSMNLKIQNSKLLYQKISGEMKVKNDQLKRLAITDQLTQLYNRLKLDEVLGYESARSQRDKTPLTVAIIDIDKFKLVNDTFGHQVGDKVLIGVADVMLKNSRSTDILGRWGGEEFMLILPNTSLKHALLQTNKLREIIEKSNFSPVKQVTISMGVACCEGFVCQQQLIELADNALYEAKENGRNRVEFAPTSQGLEDTVDESTEVAY